MKAGPEWEGYKLAHSSTTVRNAVIFSGYRSSCGDVFAPEDIGFLEGLPFLGLYFFIYSFIWSKCFSPLVSGTTTPSVVSAEPPQPARRSEPARTRLNDPDGMPPARSWRHF